MDASPANPSPDDRATRRSFLAVFGAIGAGAAAVIAPLVSGLWVFVQPFRDKSQGLKVRITSLASLPADGQPYRFPVIATRTDAWSKYPPEPIGFVYLRRKPGEEIPTAFTSVCPHLGCVVDYQSDRQRFQCPCHNSAFRSDGTRVAPDSSPSPRDLDRLEDVTVEGNEVWVVYKRFRTGKREKQQI